MVINVTGRHVEITEAMREHIHARVEKLWDEHPRIESAHVILSVEKHRHLAEIVLQGAGIKRVEAESESDDMYASIDLAVERAEKQVRKWLDRVKSHKAEGLGVIEAQEEQTGTV